MAAEGKLFLIRPRDDGPRLIFANDTCVSTPIDPTFKALWDSIKLPAEDEELRQMIRKAGMTVSSQDSHLSKGLSAGQSGSSSTSGAKKTAKRSFRRIKITNDYLEDIDLSIDPQDAPK